MKHQNNQKQNIMQYTEKLIELLRLCLEKNLTFDLCTLLNVVYVNSEDKKFFFISYYTGNLTDMDLGSTITMNELLERVRNYKIVDHAL